MSMQAGRPAMCFGRSFLLSSHGRALPGAKVALVSQLTQILRSKDHRLCTIYAMAASPTVLPPYWLEPYLGEPAEQTIAAFQSISSHPLVRNLSFEELRLAPYDKHREKLKPYLSDTSKLMTTQQRSVLRLTPPSRSIRAAADNTDKYVLSEYTCERCS